MAILTVAPIPIDHPDALAREVRSWEYCLPPAATIVADEQPRAEAIAAGPPAEHGFSDPVEWGVRQIAPPFFDPGFLG